MGTLTTMAESAASANNQTLKELEEEITCLLCEGHYREPKLLPCMHYYCKACIEKLATGAQGRAFPCPECREDTTLQSGGAEELKSAFFVERMKDLYAKMSKNEGQVRNGCEKRANSGKAVVLKGRAFEKYQEVCSSLVPLRKVQSDIASADKKLCETEAQIDSQGEAVHQSILEAFGRLKSLLEQREADLSSLATAIIKEKKDALASQRKGLQISQAEIQSLVEFVEQSLESTSDQDLMATLVQLHAKVVDEAKRHHKIPLSPVSTADIKCDLPSLDIIPKKIGNVSCQSVAIKVSNVCDVYQRCTATLHAPSFTVVSAALQSLADPQSLVQPEVVQKSSGEYEIVYTPQVRSQHDLMVKVDGRDIVGSPFRILAKIHPSQLSDPVRVIKDVNQPMGITFNQNRQIVVTEYSMNHIAILSRDGTRLQTIESNDIRSPRGVAIGPEGAFFVTCNTKHYFRLLKINSNGQTLKKVVNLRNVFGVRVIRDRVYVCVHGAVNIYTTDCNKESCLEAERCTKPYDVAEGCEKSIYVVSNTSSGVIAKFSFYGRFKGIFKEYLSRPQCICINKEGYIFVTLGSDARICVFHPNGDDIASVGWGFLCCPMGIAVDEDGFVYVCDSYGSQVVVF